MKTIARIAAQGDCLIIRVDEIPSEAMPDESTGKVIVAHSETGHHHAILDRDVTRYTTKNELIAYLEVRGAKADLIHERPYDTHETIRLPRGRYEIRNQREYTPDGWRRVED